MRGGCSVYIWAFKSGLGVDSVESLICFSWFDPNGVSEDCMLIRMVSVKIACENGEILSEDFVFDSEESCGDVMVRMASLISTCSCKFEIFAGKYIVRKGINVRRLIHLGMVLDLRYVDLQDERDSRKERLFHGILLILESSSRVMP